MPAPHTPCTMIACSRGPALEPFVVTSLVQLLCRTTKLCWFDDDAFRNIVDDAKQFLEKVSTPCAIDTRTRGGAWQSAAVTPQHGAGTVHDNQAHPAVKDEGILPDTIVPTFHNNRAQRAAARGTTNWGCASW